MTPVEQHEEVLYCRTTDDYLHYMTPVEQHEEVLYCRTTDDYLHYMTPVEQHEEVLYCRTTDDYLHYMTPVEQHEEVLYCRTTDDYLHYMTPVEQHEEGQRTSQEEDGGVPGETALEQEKENKATGLEGYNVQDVKDVLGDMTKEMLGTLQAEFTEKLRVQEESFSTRLEPLKHSACK
ncbi:uncharacterized protein LOC127921939 isoform X5 [Oncorhynchus keta]|nr:uncharacterized protein LOC127921939 isoform X5 [Oncorhynchus keta]